MWKKFGVKVLFIVLALEWGFFVLGSPPLLAETIELIDPGYGHSSLRHIEPIPGTPDKFIAAGYVDGVNGKDLAVMKLTKTADAFSIDWVYTYDGPNNNGINTNDFGKCAIPVGPGRFLVGGTADSADSSEAGDTKGKGILILLQELPGENSATARWEYIHDQYSDSGGIRYLIKGETDNVYYACGQRNVAGTSKAHAMAMKIVLNADDNILPAVPWYRVYWFDYDTKDQFVSWFEMLRLCEVAGQPQLLAVGTAYQTINDLPYGGIYLVWINPENGSEITYGAGLPKRFLLCDPGGILKTYEGRALSQELNGNFWISGFAEPGHFGGGGMKDAFLLRIPKDWVPGKPFWYQEYGDNFVIPVEQQDFGWGVQAYQVAGEVYAVLTGYTAARHYPGGSRDLWFLCVDESGAPVWENHYGTAGGDCGNSLAVLPDGSFLAAGFAGENATNPRNLYLVWTDDHFGSAAFYAGSITAEMITPASVIRGQPIRFTDVVFTNSGCGTNFIISIKAGRELPDGTYGFAAQLKTTPVTALTGQSLVFPTVVLNTATVIPGNYRFTFQVKAENETIPFIESQPFDVAVE